MGEMLTALPPATFPHTVATARALSTYGSDAHYEAALDLLVASIARGD